MLTTIEKDLIACLTAYEMDEDEVVGIMLLLQTSKEQNLLLEWIEDNTSAEKEEVIAEALRIHKSM